MYKITVFKVGSTRHAEEVAGRPAVLVDHLEAAATRNGFEVKHHSHEGLPSGDVYRDGKLVALWGIEDMEAEVSA
ncbi:hypothetical protein SEA_JEEVES_94 [Mycobacterium phage Jeeves]|uniref:Gp84-like domain-containing protein n=1 Tax=Mycobacterium phage Jeeves TaxID=2652402 RepID=A0A5J6T2H5_9CAUD|nr:hypothetical protein KNU75_gp015 [Mycobacterium phage Jeeves]QFG04569.1 hypothetical protein SEA_JEEVES_94 [Mycobacterium phage Jeeves]